MADGVPPGDGKRGAFNARQSAVGGALSVVFFAIVDGLFDYTPSVELAGAVTVILIYLCFLFEERWLRK